MHERLATATQAEQVPVEGMLRLLLPLLLIVLRLLLPLLLIECRGFLRVRRAPNAFTFRIHAVHTRQSEDMQPHLARALTSDSP